MRRYIDLFFEVLGTTIMGFSVGYAILWAISETVEHFTP